MIYQRADGARFPKGFDVQKVTDALDGSIRVALWIGGKELVRDDAPVGRQRDDVGKGAAAVDPEMPAG